MIRVSLDEQDLTGLMSGKIVKKEGVEIALQDIGWTRMNQSIMNAMKVVSKGVTQSAKRS